MLGALLLVATPALAQDDDADQLRQQAEKLRRQAEELQRKAEEAKRRAEERKRQEDAERERQAAEKAQQRQAAAHRGPAEAQPPGPSPVALRPTAVESVGGARWSSNLGFVENGALPALEVGTEARSTAASTALPPASQASGVTADTGTADGIGGGASSAANNRVQLILGLSSVSLSVPVPTATVPGVTTQAEMSGTEFTAAGKFVLRGAGSVGGWFRPNMRFLAASHETTEASMLAFTMLDLDGGIDFYPTNQLSLGPRAGVFMYPLYGVTDSTGSEEMTILAGLEYGALSRLTLGIFQVEGSLYFRNTFSTSVPYFALEGDFNLGAVSILGWFETRLSDPEWADGDTFADSFAASNPEATRLGVGVAFNFI